MSFDDFPLHPLLARNLRQVEFDSPRPIQAAAIGPLLEGRDLIGLAQTGTGKTAAFIVPMLQHLLARRPSQRKGRPIDPMSRLRALVLCPTRELAQQVQRDAADLAQGSVLRTACAYGKSAISPQLAALERGVDLLVATPGRLREMLDSGKVTLAHVRHVTVDEADRMLDMGFLPQVRTILDQIPADRQTAMFTATMPGEVEDLARTILRDPVRVEIGRHTTPVEHVNQRLVPVDDRDKVPLLLHLLQATTRSGVLVFCRTRRRVGWVAAALTRHGHAVGMLHGDKSQVQRSRALARFNNDELRVLVATDVAARGLHLDAVRTVINYDLPMTPQEYVHRIGRAAHGGGREGEAMTLLSEDDRARWRAVLDVVGVEVFAEQIEGFEPSVAVTRGERKKRHADAEARQRRKRGERPKKSRKSRPITKGQHPGTGVKRLKSAGKSKG